MAETPKGPPADFDFSDRFTIPVTAPEPKTEAEAKELAEYRRAWSLYRRGDKSELIRLGIFSPKTDSSDPG